MSYVRLELDPSTPPDVRRFIEQTVENLYFSDVHVMLRLPLPDQEIVAGQNFAIAQVLMAVIGGVSTTLYEQKGELGDLFKGVIEEFFPWDREPNTGIHAKAAAGIIYNVFRNPLTHNVGLFMDWRENKRYVVHKNYVVEVEKLLSPDKKTGHSEEWIENLEASQIRPQMSATLKVEADKRVLLVEGLYWCARRMIEKLTASAERMRKAEKFLKHYT